MESLIRRYKLGIELGTGACMASWMNGLGEQNPLCGSSSDGEDSH